MSEKLLKSLKEKTQFSQTVRHATALLPASDNMMSVHDAAFRRYYVKTNMATEYRRRHFRFSAAHEHRMSEQIAFHRH